MDFWTRLEEARARHNVLEHSFYQRWSDGELTLTELGVYAGQYRHAVQALATAASTTAHSADPALRTQLEEHAAEEASHIALWDSFTNAIDGDVAAAPTAETTECADAWAGDEGRSLLESLVVMFAIESGQPEIARVKADGLREHYGLGDRAATEYFDLHAELDAEHAAAERELIEPRLAGADQDALVAAAENALEANWKLLDGVERLNGRGA